jgi:hypothetical protein
LSEQDNKRKHGGSKPYPDDEFTSMKEAIKLLLPHLLPGDLLELQQMINNELRHYAGTELFLNDDHTDEQLAAMLRQALKDS